MVINTSKFEIAANKQRCPECGTRMEAVERRTENGAIYVWYSCIKSNCTGQWLKRIDLAPSAIEKVCQKAVANSISVHRI